MKRYTLVNSRSGSTPARHIRELLGENLDIPFDTKLPFTAGGRYVVYILNEVEWQNPDSFGTKSYFVLCALDRTQGTVRILDEGIVDQEKIDTQRKERCIYVTGKKLKRFFFYCPDESAIPELAPVEMDPSHMHRDFVQVFHELGGRNLLNLEYWRSL